MARLKAPIGASTIASVARAMGASASVVVSGLVLLAVGSAGATAYKAGGLVETIGLGLLALLAAAGVFLVFGLLSGFLRLSERAAEADIVKTVADGFDTGLQIVSRTGTVLYRNQALRSLAGTRSGRQATLEELFAGEPQSTEAFYRLNRAADRGEVREEEVYVRPSILDRQGGRWLQVSVTPFQGTAEGSRDAPLTLWQVRDVTRERTREIETVSSLRSMLALYDDLPQGLLAVAPDGRIAHINTTLAQWLGLKAELARVLALVDVVSSDGAALIRAAGRAGRVTRLDLDLLREDGRAFPVHLVCRGHGTRGVLSILVLDRGESAQEKGRAPGEAQLARTVQAAPFGIATVASDGRILDANAAFMRMFLRDDGPPETVDDLAPSADERAGEELMRALQRACIGPHGGEPGGGIPGPPARVRAPHLREPARHRRQGARGRDPLCHRRHRAEGAGAQIRPQPQDGGRRAAGGRRGARLQQRADRHHRLLRSAAADAPAHRPGLSRHHEHQVERQPRRRPGAPAAWPTRGARRCRRRCWSWASC